MDLSGLELLVRSRLGMKPVPGRRERRSKYRVFWIRGEFTVSWDAGYVSLDWNGDDQENGGQRWEIVLYRGGRPDQRASAKLLFRVDDATPLVEVADAIKHAVALGYRFTPLPSPWCWGLTHRTMTTHIADEIHSRGGHVDWVSDESMTVQGPHLEVWVVWFSSFAEWSVHATQGELEFDFRIPAKASGEVVAQVAAYWARESSLSNPSRPARDQPFPFARIGWPIGLSVEVEHLVHYLHYQGLDVLRADVANSTASGLSSGRECVTFRDAANRVLAIGRGFGADGVWTLYGLEWSNESEGLVTWVSQPWAPEASDPYSLPVLNVSSERAAEVVVSYLTGGIQGNFQNELMIGSRGLPASLIFGPTTLQGLADGVEDWAADALGLARWSRLPLPGPALIRTPHDAEECAAEWMRVLGYADATATPVGADQGIDVMSSTAIAQVKTETVPVGRPALQNLAGVAAAEGKGALFFSLSGFRATALEWADRVSMALFEFDYQGTPRPCNEHAHRMFARQGIDLEESVRTES